MVERRKETRVGFPDEEIVVMGLHSNSVGVLKNISLGGMKFEYFSDKPASDQWGSIDILANRRDHVLVPSVPCTIAYDHKGMVSNRSFTGMCVRVCGVCFGPLTDEQVDRLHHLLKLQEMY